MELKIIKYPNDILRVKCKKIEKRDSNARITLNMMSKYIKNPKNNAIGLALPQVGIDKRGFVFQKGKSVEVVINPKILNISEDYVSTVEGCLSIDGKEGRVNRWREIIVSYRDATWKRKIVTLKDLESIIFQHEFDHLRGVLFIDYLKENK